MAIKLEEKINVLPPNATYQYGNITDSTTGNPGTPVSVKTYADFHQFFERMVRENSDVSFNGLPDNDANGYQLFQALIYSMPRKFVREFDTDFDGEVVTITGQDLQTGFAEAVQDVPFYKGYLDTQLPTLREKWIDYQLQVIYEKSPGFWVDVMEHGNSTFERDDATGDVTLTMNGAPVGGVRARAIFIG